MNTETLIITTTPLDCACKGDGIIHKTKKPCPIHFLYATSEEFREVSLRLYAQSLTATVLHIIEEHEAFQRHREIGFLDSEESLDLFVELFWNPQDISERVKALQVLVRLIYGHLSRCKKRNLPKADSFDLFSFAEATTSLDHQFIWKPLYTDEQ